MASTSDTSFPTPSIISVPIQPPPTDEGPYEYQSGDIVFVLFSTTLVWLMIPGLGYFYSGMARSKNALSLILLCVSSVAVVSIQVRIFLVVKYHVILYHIIHVSLIIIPSPISGGSLAIA